MKLKKGDWVVRTQQDGGWASRCKVAGLSPTDPIQVDEVYHDDPVFYRINDRTWDQAYFKLVPLDLNQPLEDFV